MALWNDLSKRVTDTKDKTVQQAKVLTETTKLYTLIAEEKKKIEGNYHKLGMQYAQVHHEDYEEAFAEVMTAILASEKLIQDSQAQIRDIKGVRVCENCGAELAKDAAFCSGCGAVIPKPAAPVGNFCTGCGAALADGARFCTSCGTPVPAKEAPVAEAPAAEPVEEAPVVEEPRCPQCNAVLEAGMAFCTSCGCRLA